MDHLIFRLATAADIAAIMTIIRDAQERMCCAGSLQWQDGYPAEAHICLDIARGWGFVLDDGVEVAAYGAVCFDGDPAYEAIDGCWPGGAERYVVVHRLAVARQMLRRGCATEFLHRVERLASGRGVGYFRIDTNFDNEKMLGLLRREGFVYCGEIVCRDGMRKAFEKHIAICL